MSNKQQIDPCDPRLTPECFREQPERAKRLLAIKLLKLCFWIYKSRNLPLVAPYIFTQPKITPLPPPLFEPTQLSDFGGGDRYAAVAASTGSLLYVGQGASGGTKKDWWEYNPATNAWTEKTPFAGTARLYAVASPAQNGKIYTGLGGFTHPLNTDWWEYDPAGDSWTQKTDFAGAGRNTAVAAQANGKVYVGTGYDGTMLDDWWEYDPAGNSWTQKTDFPGGARRGAVAASINNKIYLATGAAVGVDKKDLWEYDPDTNSWTQKTDLPGATRRYAVAAATSKLYIGLGSNGAQLADWWEYNPATDAWTQKADFGGGARRLAVAAAVASKVFAGTGYTTTSIKDWWRQI